MGGCRFPLVACNVQSDPITAKVPREVTAVELGDHALAANWLRSRELS